MKELDKKELKSIDGGGIWGVVTWALASFAYDSLSNPKATGEAMKEGFDSGYNSINF